jgi:hypothetical protein
MGSRESLGKVSGGMSVCLTAQKVAGAQKERYLARRYLSFPWTVSKSRCYVAQNVARDIHHSLHEREGTAYLLNAAKSSDTIA